MPDHPKNSELWMRFENSFQEGLGFVASCVEHNKYVPSHSFWSSMTWADNGYPRYSEHLFDGPKDYSALFNHDWTEDGAEGSISSKPQFNTVIEWLRENARTYMFFESNFELFSPMIEGLLRDTIDRHIHQTNRFTATEAEVRSLYDPLEQWLLCDSLPFNLYIPILTANIFVDKFDICAGIRIQRMPENLQHARAPRTRHAYGHHPLVQSAATHAFVIGNLTCQNLSWIKFVDGCHSLTTYPMGDVDLLFAALRIASNVETGYAQIIMVPDGWASSYDANLLPVIMKSVKSYPSWFENGSWSLDYQPTVDEDQLHLLCEVFEGLRPLERDDTRLGLAIRRLNQAYLRDEGDDAILDVCIGMEALLSDGNEEMTHKLALRLAAVCTHLHIGDQDAEQVFAEVKRIYKFRSSVVHGDLAAASKSKTITRSDGTYSTLFLAKEHFRNVLIAMARRPEFLKPSVIDFKLLLASSVQANQP